MKAYLIRHSKTFGNTLGRYIGKTDEPLCREGIRLLEGKNYPEAERIYSSPLIRCIMTADIIYPGQTVHIVEELAECDFGMFENKNYRELAGNPLYQQWIDSGGEMPFPGGESQEDFRNRCVKGFQKGVEDAIFTKCRTMAMVVHGGTIMAVLARFARPHRDFYEWQVKNACGFEIRIDESRWKKGMREVTVCRKLDFSEADGSGA
ncbi:MAG: histidine phosphatase family protein [Ruminococcus sp.]|jgi:alpha-ribazole phosphatase